MSTLVKRIHDYTKDLPKKYYNGVWHLPLPAGREWINSRKLPGKSRRILIDALVQASARLAESKRSKGGVQLASAVITLPDWWRSQIIVFENENAVSEFFFRLGISGQLQPLSKARSPLETWIVTEPEGFCITGFKERIEDENISYDGEMWFVAEEGVAMPHMLIECVKEDKNG